MNLNLSTKALTEVAKTVARAAYFGLLGFVVLVLTVVSTSGEVSSAQVVLPVFGSVNLGLLVAGGAAGLAKLLDRYVRSSENNDLKGIAPGFLQR